jgi:serine/threonine protein kinase
VTPTRFGKYLLIDQISRGGMAEVYLGKAIGAHGFERMVALKRILPLIAEDPDFQTMFIDEAKISSSLTHANIGQVYEFGQIGATYFLTMEYISGKDIRRIRSRLAERKRHMAVPMALYIAGQLCQALDHAHRLTNLDGESMQIVHRDISPPNVVVSYQGAVKLIDFGIARARSRITRTRTGKLKGKFAYMSPEQVEGVPLDHRSDVFSAGSLLFEMLTHQRPFRGDNEIAVMNAIRDGSCPPPSAVNPDVPLAVDEIVLKALTRDRDQRYQWASEFSQAIQDYCVRTQGYGAPQLAAWMADAFSAEIEQERQLQRNLKALRLEDCDESLLDEDEEDAETIADMPREAAPTISQGVVGGAVSQDTEVNRAAYAPDHDTAKQQLAPPRPAPPVDVGPDLSDATDPERELEPGSLPLSATGPQAAQAGPIYPDGSSGVVGGAMDSSTPSAAGVQLADARAQQAVEVDGPAEVFNTARQPHPSGRFAVPPGAAPVHEATQVAAPPRMAPPTDFVGKVRFHALHLYRRGRERFDLLNSTQRIAVAGGATLLFLLLIVAMVATCGGDDPPPTNPALPPGTTGSVLVTTSQSATCTVKVDGRVHGLLASGGTLSIANINPGSHIVSLRCANFRPYSTSVRVKAGEVSLVDAPLKPE